MFGFRHQLERITYVYSGATLSDEDKEICVKFLEMMKRNYTNISWNSLVAEGTFPPVSLEKVTARVYQAVEDKWLSSDILSDMTPRLGRRIFNNEYTFIALQEKLFTIDNMKNVHFATIEKLATKEGIELLRTFKKTDDLLIQLNKLSYYELDAAIKLRTLDPAQIQIKLLTDMLSKDKEMTRTKLTDIRTNMQSMLDEGFITSQQLTKTNSSTVSQVFDNSPGYDGWKYIKEGLFTLDEATPIYYHVFKDLISDKGIALLRNAKQNGVSITDIANLKLPQRNTILESGQVDKAMIEKFANETRIEKTNSHTSHDDRLHRRKNYVPYRMI